MYDPFSRYSRVTVSDSSRRTFRAIQGDDMRSTRGISVAEKITKLRDVLDRYGLPTLYTKPPEGARSQLHKLWVSREGQPQILVQISSRGYEVSGQIYHGLLDVLQAIQ